MCALIFRKESDEDGRDDQDDKDSEALRNAISLLEAGARDLDLTGNEVGDAGAAAIGGILATNRDAQGAVAEREPDRPSRSAVARLAAALDKLANRSESWSSTATTSVLKARGRSRQAALNTNRVLQVRLSCSIHIYSCRRRSDQQPG